MLTSNILRACLGSLFLLCPFFSQTAMAQETSNSEDSLNYLSPNYRIRVGDVLQVSVSKHPELSRRISVHGDGNYILSPEGEKMPKASATDDMFHEMQTVGFTAANIAAAYREELKPMIADAHVTITVVDTLMKPGPPSDGPPPQLRDTPSPAQRQNSAKT